MPSTSIPNRQTAENLVLFLGVAIYFKNEGSNE